MPKKQNRNYTACNEESTSSIHYPFYLCMILVVKVYNFHLNVITLGDQKAFIFEMIMLLHILVIPLVM